MPYERKQRKFTCRGMNWNRPIDSIPDGEFRYLLNVRAYTDGELWARPGLSLVSNSLGATGVTDYLHSMSTLHDYNPDTGGGSARFFGYNTSVYWQNGLGLSAVTLSLVSGSWSGDPQSHIPFQPSGSPVPFMYVFDSAKQRKYSPEYQTAPGTPDEFTIGINSSYVQYVPAPSAAGAGNLDGTYNYRWVLRDRIRGISSVPGPASFDAAFASQSVTIASPNIIGLSTDYVFDLYRFSDKQPTWRLVGSVANNSSITDNLADSDLLSAQTLDTSLQTMKFQPFITRDVDRQGTVTVGAATTTDGSSLTRTAGDSFNTEWVAGTQIVVDEVACTIRRIQSSTVLYLEEDIGALGAGKSYSTTNALQANTPLGKVFGPYGAGESGLYIFGVGDVRSPGTLYWCNGNDPDTTSLPNSLEITGPSEPLQNGCLWNGRIFVWSTDRMFEVSPDLSNQGQFVAQHIPGARGLFAPWALAVGDQIYWISRDGGWSWAGGMPKSITDQQLFSFFGHDAQNGFSISIPNPENFGSPIVHYSPDVTNVRAWRLCYVDGLLYFDYPETTTGQNKTLVYDTKVMQGWSMDIYDQTGPSPAGYVSRFYESGMSPAAASSPLRTLLIGVGNDLYYSTGSADAGTAIPCSIMTGADELGDQRALKVLGDATVGAVTNAATITARILTNTNTTEAVNTTLAVSGAYTQNRITISDNQTLYTSRTFGLWLNWADSGTVRVTDYEIAYLLRPEVISKRPTDWTDDGYAGSKYLMAVIVDAEVGTKDTGSDLVIDGTDNKKVSSATYTFVAGDVGAALQIVGGTGWTQGTYIIQSVAGGAATLDHSPGAVTVSGGSYYLSNIRNVEVQYDGGSLAATIKLSGPGRYELPYSITPVVARQFRLAPSDTNTCQLYGVHYIWEKYPEYLNLQEDYDLQRWPGDKYIRGVAIEGDTQGEARSLAIQADGSTPSGSPLSFTGSGKTLTYYAFSTPFVAKELKLVPTGSWRKFSVRWIYDEYPDFAALISPWEDGGTLEPKYLRLAKVKADTGGSNVTLTLWTDNAATSYTFVINSNGQKTHNLVFEPPVIAQTFRWAPSAAWRYFSTEPVFDPYPALSLARTKIEAGRPAKYVRGCVITADSNNLSAAIAVKYDGGTAGPTCTGTWNGQQSLCFAFDTPFIAYDLQLVPSDAVRIVKVDWIYDEYPDSGAFFTPWLNGGTDKPKYIRSARIRCDTSNAARTLTFWSDGAATATTFNITANGQTEQTVVFEPPVVSHLMRWKSNGAWRHFETYWDFDEYPSISTARTSITGTTRAKYVRGVRVVADSGNAQVNIAVKYNGGTSGPTLTGTFNGKQVVAFAFTPIVAYDFQLVPAANCRIFGEPEWIYDEYPDLTALTTPWMDGGTSFPKYIRAAKIRCDTNNSAVTLTFWKDGAATATTFNITSDGQQEKTVVFEPPVAAQLMRWVPSAAWRHFQTDWVYDTYPLLSTARTPVFAGGRAKYVRGVRIPADSGNVQVTVGIRYNGGIVGPDCTGTWNGRQTVAFSFATPFVAYEFQLVPGANTRIWHDEVEWIYDEYPDLISITTPWSDAGDQRSKYVRGGRVRIDTNNLAINATLWVDGTATAVTKSFQSNGQSTVDFSLNPPVVAKQIRWVPASPWRYWDTFIDGEIYPGLVDQRTPVLTPGGPGAKYMKGMLLTADTNGVSRNFDLLYDGPLVGPTISAFTFTGKSTKPAAFATPFVAHNIQIVPSGSARIFHEECEFLFDPYPELTAQLSSVLTPGGPGAKFIQGVRITADSENVARSFVIRYDGQNTGPTIPATAYNGKTTVPFSFASPFIAHNLQLVPSGNVRLFEKEIEWIFEPCPDFALYWETQQTNHDMPGWHSLADMWVAYQSYAGATGSETLVITTEYGTETYSLPVNTTYARTYLRLAPQKAKWRKYRITSTLGVRLFVKDTAVRIAPWGMGKDQGLVTVQPFGDLSRESGARI